MHQTYYIIRDRMTFECLPEVKYSYTKSEPTCKKPPRLFTTKAAAQNALTWWTRGHHFQDLHTTDGLWSGDIVSNGPTKPKIVPGRAERAKYLDVVPVKLQEI